MSNGSQFIRRRLGRGLNPPTVIATIALFVALGGGYAIAFKGSGTLQKAGHVGISGSAAGNVYEDIRTLTGIGAIGAACDTDNGNVQVGFRNSSGEVLSVYGRNDDAAPLEIETVASSNTYVAVGSVSFFGGQTLHIAPGDGSKLPQASVSITMNESGNCATSQISVLALNTQQ